MYDEIRLVFMMMTKPFFQLFPLSQYVCCVLCVSVSFLFDCINFIILAIYVFIVCGSWAGTQKANRRENVFVYFFDWNWINKSNDDVYATFTSAKLLNACHRFNRKFSHLKWNEARDCVCHSLSLLLEQMAKIALPDILFSCFSLFFPFRFVSRFVQIILAFFTVLIPFKCFYKWIRKICVMISFSIRLTIFKCVYSTLNDRINENRILNIQHLMRSFFVFNICI